MHVGCNCNLGVVTVRLRSCREVPDPQCFPSGSSGGSVQQRQKTASVHVAVRGKIDVVGWGVSKL